MKVVAIIAVTLTLLAASNADEERKEKILNFWKCMTCHEDPVVLEEFIKCKQLKPEKSEKLIENCRDEVMPGLETIRDRWPYFCKNENQERERFYECMGNHEGKKDFDDEEKSKLKEHWKCVKKIKEKFCPSS